MSVVVVNAAPSFPVFSPQLEDRLYGLVANALTSREALVRRFGDPRRNLDDECGYPKVVRIQDYQDLYDRNGVANRVVGVLAEETWQVQPVVYEDDDPEVETAFERDFNRLGQNLNVGSGPVPGSPVQTSSYRPPGGSVIWEYLKRLDVVSGIGRYGILLLGLDDGKPLEEPASYRPGQKLTYLRTFPEILCPVHDFERNKANPRYGQPTSYQVSFNSTQYDETTTGTELSYAPGETRRVHWTRVIHVADNLLSSEVFGVPREQPVLNYLLNCDKLYGGSAEMYWRGAFPGISFETHPQLGADPEIDLAGMRQMAERYMNGLQRYLALVGMYAKSLAPQVVDPTPQIMVQIQAICIKLGIPMRIFMGSERGELSSSQDTAEWNDRLRQRQRDHATPRLVVPFVDRMIQLGCCTAPKLFQAWWPDLTSQTGQEKSQIAFQRTQALVQYVKGEGWRIIPPLDFLSRVLGFDEMEAAAILKNATDQGLFDLDKIQTSGRQSDYTQLGTERSGNGTAPSGLGGGQLKGR